MAVALAGRETDDVARGGTLRALQTHDDREAFLLFRIRAQGTAAGEGAEPEEFMRMPASPAVKVLMASDLRPACFLPCVFAEESAWWRRCVQ